MWQLGKNRSYWKTTDQIIMQWLQERQSLLITFNELCQTHYGDEESMHPQMVQYFCQKLMDYMSMGHFKIFEKMADAQSNCYPAQGELDTTLMTNILKSTMEGLEFNDRYESVEEWDRQTFSQELSNMGQALAQRMDCEDKLIKRYLDLTSHLPKTAASF